SQRIRLRSGDGRQRQSSRGTARTVLRPTPSRVAEHRVAIGRCWRDRQRVRIGRSESATARFERRERFDGFEWVKRFERFKRFKWLERFEWLEFVEPVERRRVELAERRFVGAAERRLVERRLVERRCHQLKQHFHRAFLYTSRRQGQ